MLDLVNRYAHGFVAIPIILACEEYGLFKKLKISGSLSAEKLTIELNANSGHLHVALRLLVSMNWLCRDENNQYSLTSKCNEIKPLLSSTYDLINFSMYDYFCGKSHIHLKTLIDMNRKLTTNFELDILDFIDGTWVLPLWLYIKQEKIIVLEESNQSITFSTYSNSVTDELINIFLAQNWAEYQTGNKILQLQ